MKDPRIEKLAWIVVNYSIQLQKRENLLIEVEGHHPALAKAILIEAFKAGGNASIIFTDQEILKTQILHRTSDHWEQQAIHDHARMNAMDAYILIRASDNSYELADIPHEHKDRYWRDYYHRVHEPRWAKTKWCILSYPTTSAAQRANMPTETFEDYYFDVCTLDYRALANEMDKLVALLEKTDIVRIEGPGTDLTMSIKGMPVQKDAGHQNLPDGEVFAVPRKYSVNGKIAFNTPVIFRGFAFENIALEFKDGKIVHFQANDSSKLQQILDTDEGARYLGEFGIGLNPFITKPLKDILFDEKIWGSIHLAIGSAPTQCEESNLSSIHWDIVLNQCEEWGGGKLWFDNILVRENGHFVLEGLKGLNRECLKEDS